MSVSMGFVTIFVFHKVLLEISIFDFFTILHLPIIGRSKATLQWVGAFRGFTPRFSILRHIFFKRPLDLPTIGSFKLTT